jgi:hypothetical protein
MRAQCLALFTLWIAAVACSYSFNNTTLEPPLSRSWNGASLISEGSDLFILSATVCSSLYIKSALKALASAYSVYMNESA